MSLETSGLSTPKPKEQKRLPKAGEAFCSVLALLVLVLILILALILALVLVAVLFVSHGALPPV